MKWFLQVRAVISISLYMHRNPMSLRSLRHTKQRPDAGTPRHWMWALWALRNRDDHTYRGMPRFWQTDARNIHGKENIPRCFHRDKCPRDITTLFFATYKSVILFGCLPVRSSTPPPLTPYGYIDSPTVYNRLSAVQHGPGNDEGIVV